MTAKTLTRISPLAIFAAFAVAPQTDAASLLVGADFEGAAVNIYDENPDDYNLSDSLIIGPGGNENGWFVTRNSDGVSVAGFRDDTGARNAGATTPNFPTRLEGGRTAYFTALLTDGLLNMDRIEFDVRGATGGTGRVGQFRTSLQGDTEFLWEESLVGRNTTTPLGNGWKRITIDLTAAQYQNIDDSIDFVWRTPGGAIDLDTIRVYGTIVPSPSAALAGLIGLGGLMVRRRRG